MLHEMFFNILIPTSYYNTAVSFTLVQKVLGKGLNILVPFLPLFITHPYVMDKPHVQIFT